MIDPCDDDDDPMVIVCAGPPACNLDGSAAVLAQKLGCIWCKRIACHPDGTETETGPAHG